MSYSTQLWALNYCVDTCVLGFWVFFFSFKAIIIPISDLNYHLALQWTSLVWIMIQNTHLVFSFLLRVMLCFAFRIFGRWQKLIGWQAIVIKLGEVLAPFMTSQRVRVSAYTFWKVKQAKNNNPLLFLQEYIVDHCWRHRYFAQRGIFYSFICLITEKLWRSLTWDGTARVGVFL